MLAYPFKKVEDLRPFLRPFFTEHHLQMLLKGKTLLLYVSCVYLKVRLSTSKKKCFICFNGSPLKMMKNAIYLILKAFFIFKIFNFLSWFSVHVYGTPFRPKVEICFHVEQSRFSCWKVEIFLLNGRDFHVERSVAKAAWLERSG